MNKYLLVSQEGFVMSVVVGQEPPLVADDVTLEQVPIDLALPAVPLMHRLRWPDLSLVDERTPEYYDEQARILRNQKLAATDWVVTRAMDTGTPVPTQWAEYRQALRDVTQQPGFPNDIVWPVPPSA